MKRWSAGLITVSVTFGVTLLYLAVTAKVLEDKIDEVRLPILIVAAVIGLLGAIAFVVVAFSLYKLIDPREALGLPPGSVRALLALLLLVIFASMTVFFFGALRNAPPNVENGAAADIAKQVLTILGTLLAAVSGFYFGTTSTTNAAKIAGGTNNAAPTTASPQPATPLEASRASAPPNSAPTESSVFPVEYNQPAE